MIVAGLVSELRELITKKGTRMAFGKVEDLTGSCELVIFPDSFARFEQQLKDERPALIGGTLEVEEGNAKIMVDNISPLEDILKKTKRMILKLDQIQPTEYERLGSLMREYPGTTAVGIEIELEDVNRRVLMEMGDSQGVNVNNDFFEGIHSLFGRTDFIELRA
ncbi:DNA polymerase III subunit alpha [compost metagenome]